MFNTNDAAVFATAQIREQLFCQLIFMGSDQSKRFFDFCPGGAGCAASLAQRCQIINNPSSRIGNLIIGIARLQLRRHFILAVEVVIEIVELGHQLILAVEHGGMRAVDLVNTESEKIDVPGLNVHRPMGGVGNTVHADQCPALMHKLGDLIDGIYGTQDIGDMGHRHQSSAVSHQGVKIFQPELQ